MPRPNRKSQEFWFDTFADMPIPDQAAALKILEQVHRLAVRESRRGAFARVDTPDNPDLLERNAALDLDEGPKQ